MRGLKPAGWAHILAVASLLALVLIAYANSLKNDFVWDDNFLVKDNTYIRNPARIWDLFRTYLAYSSGSVNNFYRPIQELSYMADYKLWRYKPFGYHLTNVILHALCAACVYMVALRILKSGFAAFIAAALFGVHPVNTEAVAYVAGRADSLYLLFFLLSFILFLVSIEGFGSSARPRPYLYASALFFYILSLLSKEIAIIFPVMLAAYIFTFWPKGILRNRLYRLCAPFGLVVLLYAIARSIILSSFGPAPAPILARFGILTRFFTSLKALSVYLGLLAAPFDLHMERKMDAGSLSILDGQTLWAIFIFAVLTAILAISYTRSKRLFFAGIWFFAGLLPVANIVPINSFIAEHWLYLPAIGIYMITGAAIDNLFFHGSKGAPVTILRRTTGVFVTAAMLACFAILTFERNKDWRDEVVFFGNTLKYSPQNGRLRLNLGNAYYRRGEKEKALAEFRASIEEYKKVMESSLADDKAYRNVGIMYAHLEKYAEAKFYLERSLAIAPNDPQALYTLGVLYEMAGDYNMAEIQYTNTLYVMPDYARCRTQLGVLYLKTGNVDKALAQWERALEISPDNVRARELINKYSKARI